jgi:hypothetical protein
LLNTSRGAATVSWHRCGQPLRLHHGATIATHPGVELTAKLIAAAYC